jgi:hypothetical protein
LLEGCSCFLFHAWTPVNVRRAFHIGHGRRQPLIDFDWRWRDDKIGETPCAAAARRTPGMASRKLIILSGFVASGNAASVSRPAEAVTASRAKPNDHERQGEADTYSDTDH